MARIVDGPEITGQVVHRQTGQAYGPVTVTVSPQVYTDREMTSSTTTLTTDGQGVYSCYAPPGQYTFTTTAADSGPLEPVEVLGKEGGTGKPSSAAYASKAQVPVLGAEGYRVLTILVYHVVASSAAFNADLDLYRQWNYTTVDPDQVYAWMQGTGTLPDKPLLITFDDGYASQWTNAWPGLQARNMKATWYVSTAWVDGTESQGTGSFLEATPITWAQLSTMYATGLVRVQSHTVTHADLTTLTAGQVTSDFTTAKARIESQVAGETVWHVAYPFASYSPTVQAALTAGGCRTARTIAVNPDGTFPGPNSSKYEFCTLFSPALALPCAGTGAAQIQQPNYLRKITRDEEMAPDYGFASGAALGWSLGAGFTVDNSTLPPGFTQALKSVQQTSSVSSKLIDPIPVGQYAAVQWSIWLKISGNLGGANARLLLQSLRYDNTTVGSSSTYISATSTTGTNGWQQFTGNFYGDINTFFLQAFLTTGGIGTPVATVWYTGLSIKRAVHPPVMPWV